MSICAALFILYVQEDAPSALRNSKEWREQVSRALCTGRDHEQERLSLVLNWLWGDVLDVAQSLAYANGFCDEWNAARRERSKAACEALALALNGARIASAHPDARKRLEWLSAVAWALVAVTSDLSPSATLAASVHAVAAVSKTQPDPVQAWQDMNPGLLLSKLVAVSEEKERMSKVGANEKRAAPRNSTRDARGNMSAAALKAGGVETYFGAGFWLTLEFCQTVNKFRILANDGAESAARANLGEWETLSAARTAFSEWRKYLEKHERQIVESRARIVREVTRKIRGKASV